MVSALGSLKPLLICYGGLKRSPDGPACGTSGLLVFPPAHQAATYICDAMAVSKGFCRLRQGQRCVSNTNQDLWSAIREAAKQRDVEVHCVASHEKTKIDRVDATTAWFIGLNTLADGVLEVAAEMCDFPETVPALTSWVEGKRIRHRAALTTVDAIERDPIASLPFPKRVKPTIDDLKLASEHDVVGHMDSVTCNRCG